MKRVRHLVTAGVAVVAVCAAAPPAEAVTGYVLNSYVRTCSYVTGKCTPYKQINGPHDYTVGNTYRTTWVWYAIW
jgi:hypothetical protein